MNLRVVLRVIGALLVFLAATLLLPLVWSLAVGDGLHWSFAGTAAGAALVGLALLRGLRRAGQLGHREGFAVVTFGWLALSLAGAVPFLAAGVLASPVDALFESTSGFTATGATVMQGLDAQAPSLLVWRALSQWIGGMGIIVLGLAILPLLGIAGMQLYQAEMTGPTADRLTPRVQDTAKILWSVYVLLTAVLLLALLLSGLDLLDATCHAFSTMATGGFSTRDASVGAFDSSGLHVLITVFMLIGGTNFALHHAALGGRPGRYLQSKEFLAYVGLFAGATILVTGLNAGGDARHLLLTLRDAAFQVASLLTSTGYTTTDYDRWPEATRGVLLVLMLVGGCAASTAGGVKVVRVLLVLEHAFLQVIRLAHPREIKVMKLDHAFVPGEVVRSILGFMAAYALALVAGTLVLAATGVDLFSAGAAVLSGLSNIGPAMGAFGPSETYAAAPAAAKLVLIGCMILGRLELFTVLVLFLPSFWRR